MLQLAAAAVAIVLESFFCVNAWVDFISSANALFTILLMKTYTNT